MCDSRWSEFATASVVDRDERTSRRRCSQRSRQIVFRGRFVERNADRVVGRACEDSSQLCGAFQNSSRCVLSPRSTCKRVEEIFVHDLEAGVRSESRKSTR